MKIELYTIKDELSEFAPPLPLNDEENAKRYLAYKLKTDDFMKLSPKDFSIWKCGEMDTVTGEVKGMMPQLIERGHEDNGN